MTNAMSPTIAGLAAALAAAQAEIENASKDTTNPHFGKKYADLASVWNACRAPLGKNGLAIFQGCSAEGPRVTVNTTLMHKTGEWISSELTITAQQNTPQAIGSAITYARRYALSAAVGVAPEEDDGNAATSNAQVSAIHENARRAAVTSAPAPVSDLKVRHDKACDLIKKKLGSVKGTVEIGKIKTTMTEEGKSKLEILEFLEGFAGAPSATPDSVPM